MTFTTLVDTKTLADHSRDPDWAIVDCRFNLRDPAWGRRAYAEGHIPDAVFASLDEDLSGHKTGRNGRHPLPDVATISATLGRFGIAPGVQVAAYDQDTGMFASRLWWLLRWLGHDAAAVLDGGFRKWTAEQRPVVRGEQSRSPKTFTPAPRPELIVSSDDVRRGLGGKDYILVDARAANRYRGDVEPLDRVAGHIPGARNFFHAANVTDQGTFRTPADIRERWQREVGDAPADRVVNYCGSGVTACHNVLALEHAGLGGGRLYPGSWSEWSSDPDRPVEKSKKS